MLNICSTKCLLLPGPVDFVNSLSGITFSFCCVRIWWLPWRAKSGRARHGQYHSPRFKSSVISAFLVPRADCVAWERGKTKYSFAAFGRCRSIYRHREICPSVWTGMFYRWRGHIPPCLCILTAEEQLTAEIHVIWEWNAIYTTRACQTVAFSRWQWNEKVSVRSLGNKEIF